jgi:hypothetical protein
MSDYAPKPGHRFILVLRLRVSVARIRSVSGLHQAQPRSNEPFTEYLKMIKE